MCRTCRMVSVEDREIDAIHIRIVCARPNAKLVPGGYSNHGRIIVKDRLQVDAVQGREQQGDDCDRLQHANLPQLYLAMSVYLTRGGFAVPLQSFHFHRP